MNDPQSPPAALPPTTPLPPTVSIYQNPDYVEGILQQIYGQPLYTEFANETTNDQIRSGDHTSGVAGKAELRTRFPGLFAGGAAAEADYEYRLQNQRSTANTATSKAHYTQPYYLHVVRSALRNTGLITDVTGESEAQASLSPGGFVEFSTTFRPSQISALLDIITPDLVEQLVRKSLHTKEMATFEGGSPEQAQRFKLNLDGNMDTWGAIGRAATEALRADFRSTKTREFYGRVGHGEDQLTFITMCDTEHFVVEDEDRILDGTFTVLGKVAGPIAHDEPILARNKVLERLSPEIVDQALGSMNQYVRNQSAQVSVLNSNKAAGTGGHDDLNPADILNFAIDTRIDGASLRVMPIAIFL